MNLTADCTRRRTTCSTSTGYLDCLPATVSLSDPTAKVASCDSSSSASSTVASEAVCAAYATLGRVRCAVPAPTQVGASDKSQSYQPYLRVKPYRKLRPATADLYNKSDHGYYEGRWEIIWTGAGVSANSEIGRVTIR